MSALNFKTLNNVLYLSLFVLINNSKVTYTEKELTKESMSSISEVNRQLYEL